VNAAAPFRALAVVVLLAAACIAPGARAAESYDACTNFISSVPTSITSPGVYCLTHDLVDSNSGLTAVFINSTHDVTVDCNGFRIDASALGPAVSIVGVEGYNSTEITVRNCHLRGFGTGIVMHTPSGPASLHDVIEDNRIELSRETGIAVSAAGSVIRRNHVLDTVSSLSGTPVTGIVTGGNVDVVDNLVSGVQSFDSPAAGIRATSNPGGSVRGNRIRGVRRTGTNGAITAIDLGATNSQRMIVRDNTLTGEGQATSVGVSCGVATDRVKNNAIKGFATALVGCPNDGNVIKP
jgi:hypothetical protein